MRPIDADALIEILAEMQGRCATKAALVQNSKIWQQVKAMPTVDAQPVRHGRWVYATTAESVDYEYSCSNCGYSNFADVIQAWDYCPHCGAKMEGEGK